MGNVETNTKNGAFCHLCGKIAKHFNGRYGGVSEITVWNINDFGIGKYKGIGELDRERNIVGYTFSGVYRGVSKLRKYELIIVNVNGKSISATNIGSYINKIVSGPSASPSSMGLKNKVSESSPAGMKAFKGTEL